MHQIEFSPPPADTQHLRPQLVLQYLPVSWRNEIKHVQPQCIVEGSKSQRFKTCRINIPNLTAERGDTDEIGRSLHQGCKSSLICVSQPLLEGNRRLICSGIQEQLLCFGWK